MCVYTDVLFIRMFHVFIFFFRVNLQHTPNHLYTKNEKPLSYQCDFAPITVYVYTPQAINPIAQKKPVLRHKLISLAPIDRSHRNQNWTRNNCSAHLGQGIRMGGGSVVPITGPGGLQQHSNAHHHHSVDRRSSGSLRVSFYLLTVAATICCSFEPENV